MDKGLELMAEWKINWEGQAWTSKMPDKGNCFTLKAVYTHNKFFKLECITETLF